MWDGIVAAHGSTCMSWRRVLFRLWLVASGVWMCVCAHYIWRTCEAFGQELWCRTDYSSALSKFTTWTSRDGRMGIGTAPHVLSVGRCDFSGDRSITASA